MKEHKKGSGAKKWLLLSGIFVLVAALVAGGLYFFLGDKKEPEAAIGLYWNVERKEYVNRSESMVTARMARADGYYYVRFAAGGEQIDLKVGDLTLLQKIDQLDLVGLKLDADGVITEVYNVNECSGGLVASNLYITEINGNTVKCNTHGGMAGVDVEIELEEDTQIYDVGTQGLLCGMATTLKVDDEIIAVKDYDGKISHVFALGYQAPGDVYWNLDRMYDSNSKTSTREMDPTGGYSFQMAFNGEEITVRTRDYDIVTAIDAKAAKCTGLVFDENDYVIEVTSAAKSAGGTTFASWAHVFSVNDREIFARKLSGGKAGEEYIGTMSKDCKIINVSGVGGARGSYTDLRYGDQIHGLTDNRGRVCYIWVVNRLAGDEGWKLYTNAERKYDKEAQVTTRTPDADGWYYFDVATGGQAMQVKTQNINLANQLDSYAARCFTMLVDENNEIVQLGSAGQIHGGSTFGSWYYVDAIEENRLTVSRILTGDTEPTVLKGIMAEDVEIINASTNYVNNYGEYTTLTVGDRVHCLKDLDGNIRVIFIVEKLTDGPMYWNLGKKPVDNGVTTRKRAADGYFYFTMAANGKEVVLKTKDIEIATKVDSMAARCMGLVLKGDVIIAVTTASSVSGHQGGTKSLSWVDVTNVSGSTITAKKNQSGHKDDGKIFTTTMAPGCKVYNVSSNYKVNGGEVTTVRKGDRIHVLHNKDGQAVLIYVVNRDKNLTETDECPCQQNVKWEPWDGTTALENGKSYYLTKDITAPAEGFVLEGINVNLRLDGHTISSIGRCFYVKSSVRLNICDHNTRGKLIGSGIEEESGGVIRVASSSCVVNLYNIDVERASAKYKAKEGGLISNSGVVSLYNCNLRGGEASSIGGNLRNNTSGTLRMFGGSISGGKASSGANGVLGGRVYMENVTITGGAFTVSTDKEQIYNGITCDSFNVTKGTATLKGKVNLAKLTLKDTGVLADGGIAEGSYMLVNCKPEKSCVIMTGASKTAFAAMESFDPVDYALSYDAAKKQVTVTNKVTVKTHSAQHCLCLGKVAGHSCENLTGWIAITDDVFEEAKGLDGKAAGVKFKADGNYYLPKDYTLKKTICIMPGQKINICLNGADLRNDSGRVFQVAGELSITDCTGVGTVNGGATSNGGTLKLLSGGKASLYGGTLTASGHCTQGGVIAISTDSGNIVNNSPAAAAQMNIYGGTVKGGSADTGSNIQIWSSISSLNIYGGTVTGAKGGDSINVFAGKFTLSGNADITGSKLDLYLVKSAKVTLEHYSTTKTVKLKMEIPGVIAAYSSDIAKYFASCNEGYNVAYIGGKLRMELDASQEGHIHCACGGTAKGLHAHDCSNLKYEPWDGTTPLVSGNYYLTKDVTITAAEGILIDSNQINLCLNGHHITAPNGRAFYLKTSGGSLHICDHEGNNGYVEAAGVAAESGGVIRVGATSAQFGAYNITLKRIETDAPAAVTEGGVIICAGKLYLYNCTVQGGYAKNGGNLNLVNISKSVVVGCTITGGEAFDTNGGNIRLSGSTADDPATLTLVDSVVTQGKAATTGDGIYLLNNRGQLTLMGKVEIRDNAEQNLYLTGNDSLQVQDLSKDSRIGIYQAVDGVVVKAAEALMDCFVSDKGVSKYYDGENICMGYVHSSHCVCAGACVEVGDHTCTENVQWQAFTTDLLEATSNTNQVIINASGNYYLTDDVSITKEIVIPTGVEVSICLQGHTFSGTRRIFRVNGILNITDCGENGAVEGSAALAPVFYGYAGGVINLYGGTLRSTNDTPASRYWGGVGALANDAGMASAKAPSAMNMYGGKIEGTSVIKKSDGKNGNGGAIAIMSGSTFTLYGGEIVGGSAELGGAAISVDNTAKQLLLGGQVTAGTQSDKLVYAIGTNSKVTVGGKAVVESLFLQAGGKLLESAQYPLAEGASIGVAFADGTGTVLDQTNSSVDYTRVFRATESGKALLVESGKVVVKEEENE